jgi:ADP-ribosylglycohydrolase
MFKSSSKLRSSKESPTRGRDLRSETRNSAIVSSALWAAAGDAVGWITELADASTVTYRTGHSRVTEPTSWRRRIGGRFGPTVDLPAGTYSDDTQLRLSVCRAIRGNGDFDVAAFAKVELPVWLAYSLGGGRSTTAAAYNLGKPSVAWFSNFFSSKDTKGYLQAGGNGAAMRIQPHVWKSSSGDFEAFVPEVIRDAIVTHGHATGICGAVLHALSLAYAINKRALPGFEEWREFVNQLRLIPETVAADQQLGIFWLGPWETQSGHSFASAVEQEAERAKELLQRICKHVESGPAGYSRCLTELGGFDAETRGAGTNTALAACVLAGYGRDISVEKILVLGANALGSDTDTITSMAGAILGAIQGGEPQWRVQDRSYIAAEAMRLAEIGSGRKVTHFPYPDLLSWTPPTSQVDAVRSKDRSLWLIGLGSAEPFGEAWSTAEAKWQWLNLPFGQSVFAKRRAKPKSMKDADMPAEKVASEDGTDDNQPSLFAQKQANEARRQRRNVRAEPTAPDRRYGGKSLDELTEWIIEENFRPEVIGNALLAVAQDQGAIERSIALASIVAKAIQARKRRSQR